MPIVTTLEKNVSGSLEEVVKTISDGDIVEFSQELGSFELVIDDFIKSPHGYVLRGREGISIHFNYELNTLMIDNPQGVLDGEKIFIENIKITSGGSIAPPFIVIR